MDGKTAFATILQREGVDVVFLGANAEHVTDPAEVGPTIERAKEISTTGQPCVLEIITRESRSSPNTTASGTPKISTLPR